jgi:hypothetical protein
MNRRGFLRLLAGGAAAFRALGLPVGRFEKAVFGSGSDGDTVLRDNTILLKGLEYKHYEKVNLLGGWSVTILPVEVIDVRRM